ncbi:glycoside hydrolase family 64 protein [Amycolatopsis suaedae]|uniref:Beta-1,3-glucanase n=1 Tax=Amycolatopsis suaedae TaxID=2510978 RepID=A0A4Q7J9D0_9PSEU|nr:glycoside hydrolase family 64 protein [Amycolatopsis suaedae]RZQ63827.1 beta-1,3-glucanase [Amycolatopsis suaedae]
MISRRTFLGASAAALAVPALARLSASAQTPETFRLALVNNSGSNTAFAYVTGLSGGKPLFVRPNGSSYYPPSPGAPVTPLPEDCSIPLGGQGSTTTVSVPRMYGARIYVVTGEKLSFFVNPGPHVVHPSFLNTGDPNFARNWTFAEFTFNEAELFANISYVDFVAAPLGLSLRTASGKTETVPGLPAGALGSLVTRLEEQAGRDGAPWGSLVQRAGGQPLRAMSAHYKAGEFGNYLGGYVDEVWNKYRGTDLKVDTQASFGVLTGRVGGDGQLRLGSEGFAKPSTADIFSCDSGPFSLGGASDLRKALIPRLAAALNRTTLLANADQPNGEKPDQFYRTPATNHYARIVHELLPDNRGYAFPYDDVTATGGPDFSGAVRAGDPDVLTVTVKSLR